MRCRDERFARRRWAAVLMATLLVTQTYGLSQSATEAQAKAAFLYNFAKFVEWPPHAFADAASPLVIGILGKDPLGRDLDDVVRGRTAAGRIVVVRRYASGTLPDSHILFISGSERARIPDILKALKESGTVLTVSDVDGFANAGGMIHMFAAEGQIRLRINAEAAHHVGLLLSSKLLGAATIVRTDGEK